MDSTDNLLQGNPQAAEQEKQALRIQAAAVAAQQAALTEEEIRLEQRRTSLEQQERQLAALLEEKRQRLVVLRDEARQAHVTLQTERTTYERRVAEVMRDLALTRREQADNHRQNQTERQRVAALRRRLKHRWHRHWSAERAAMRRKEAAVAAQQLALERDRKRLQQEKDALEHARRQFNGEAELARRQMQVETQQLKQAQAEHQERVRLLDRRESALGSKERHWSEEQRSRTRVRSQLQNEVEGLESRIRNYRRALQQQERRLTGLQADNRQLHESSDASLGIHRFAQDVSPPSAPSPRLLPAPLPQRNSPLLQPQADLQSCWAALERTAEELADQRLALAEQCERLKLANECWQQDRLAALAALEAVGRQFQEREDALRVREEALEAARQGEQQRTDELTHAGKSLEVSKARLAARAAAWEGERSRLCESVRVRQESLEQRLTALETLRQRCEQRRRRQVAWLWNQRSACERLRRECAALREEWFRKNILLTEEQRALAERALGLEQYRQDCIGRAANPKAAEKRMRRLRRRCAVPSVSARRLLAQERRLLEAEAARVEGQSRQLQDYAQKLALEQTDLSSEQEAWEQEQLRINGEQERLRHELEILTRQRAHYEQQLGVFRDEVEHLARLLLDEVESDPAPVIKAA